MTWDIVIHRGLLIDGSGSQGTIADIALAAGRIAAIGPSLPGEASKAIDAEGLIVTPGFIDIKTHSDFVLPINPKAESKVRQGVTTEIIGHCGFSVAPVLPGKTQLLADYLSGGAPWLPFREMGFSEIPRHVPGGCGQCGHAGRAQHAQTYGDGPRGSSADQDRTGADDRASGGWPARGCARHVVGPIHTARQLCHAGRNDGVLRRPETSQCGVFHPHAR